MSFHYTCTFSANCMDVHIPKHGPLCGSLTMCTHGGYSRAENEQYIVLKVPHQGGGLGWRIWINV